jgi:hypothetical protein
MEIPSEDLRVLVELARTLEDKTEHGQQALQRSDHSTGRRIEEGAGNGSHADSEAC